MLLHLEHEIQHYEVPSAHHSVEPELKNIQFNSCQHIDHTNSFLPK